MSYLYGIRSGSLLKVRSINSLGYTRMLLSSFPDSIHIIRQNTVNFKFSDDTFNRC